MEASLYLGSMQSCYLDGETLWCWGRDAFGNLGRGEVGEQLRPSQATQITEAISLAIGEWWGCMLRRDSSVWCWGSNFYGHLGNGTERSSLTPVMAKDLPPIAQITAGELHACALTKKGEVYCWGLNEEGSLGVEGSSVQNVPKQLTLPMSARQIDAGSAHTCALLEDGSVWCWGKNSLGQLGSLDPKEKGPHRVSMGYVRSISVGGDRACAVTNDKTLYCWGVAHLASIYGEKAHVSSVGTHYYTKPILIDGLADITAVSVGYNQSCVLTREQTVFCINGSSEGKESAIAAAGLRGVVEISAGASACARLEDQTVWCWGTNNNGTIGNGKKTAWEKPNKIWPTSK
jgi:alpha-tubulin suppressor-like RCC1 family protein